MSNNEKKYYDFTCLLNHYVKALLKGNTIAKELEKRGIRSVALYGMSFMGERVVEDICASGNVSVEYGIDKRADLLDVSIPVYLPTEEVPKVDLIIVTTLYGFDDIRNHLTHNDMCVSVEHILNLIYNLSLE